MARRDKTHKDKITNLFKQIISSCGNCSALEIKLQMLSFSLSWKDWVQFFDMLSQQLRYEPKVDKYVREILPEIQDRFLLSGHSRLTYFLHNDKFYSLKDEVMPISLLFSIIDNISNKGMFYHRIKHTYVFNALTYRIIGYNDAVPVARFMTSMMLAAFMKHDPNAWNTVCKLYREYYSLPANTLYGKSELCIDFYISSLGVGAAEVSREYFIKDMSQRDFLQIFEYSNEH